jgi:hypothetical protein
MFRKPYPCCAVALAILWTTAAAADPTWSQVRAESSWTEHSTRNHGDAGEVTVLKATVEGVECWRADAKVDVDSKYMMDVAMDIEGTIGWATTAHVSEAKVLARSGSALEYYQLMDVPGWTLAKDRFWFVRGRVINESGATSFAWQKLDEGGDHGTAYAEFVADHEDAIEPPVNVGGWHFTPVSDGTEIRYHICTDSGGAIPQKIQSMATSSTLPDTVGDLVREARKRAK